MIYKSPKRKSKSKRYMLAVCLLLTAMLAIGGTIAYLFTQTDPVTNTFNPVEPGTTIVEKFTGKTKSNVQVQNTGEVDSYIRAKVVITWQNANGDIYAAAPVEGTDYSISYNTTDWTKASDGYWYHNSAVAAKGLTAVLINSATQLRPCADTAYTLHIEILSQAVQSTPEDAIKEAWGVTVSSSGVTAVPTT